MADERTVQIVVPARPGQRQVIANLIQLYLYDMTGDLPFPVGADGLFAYDYLDRFWQHPYLIQAGGELAGFALVIAECPVTGASPCWFMAEFFVLKAYRGRGLGRDAADSIISRHPGTWHIGVIERNAGAARFWERVVRDREAVATRHDFDGEDWVVRAFRSGVAR